MSHCTLEQRRRDLDLDLKWPRKLQERVRLIKDYRWKDSSKSIVDFSSNSVTRGQGRLTTGSKNRKSTPNRMPGMDGLRDWFCGQLSRGDHLECLHNIPFGRIQFWPSVTNNRVSAFFGYLWLMTYLFCVDVITSCAQLIILFSFLLQKKLPFCVFFPKLMFMTTHDIRYTMFYSANNIKQTITQSWHKYTMGPESNRKPTKRR